MLWYASTFKHGTYSVTALHPTLPELDAAFEDKFIHNVHFTNSIALHLETSDTREASSHAGYRKFLLEASLFTSYANLLTDNSILVLT